ncbi:monovalent cation/H(+) antiporter subunit G [Natrinema salaciae]|uniref:Multisubunit sodium/proton antiporter, MrpG subunit n=1 Tax=Natrinema salaciae TaxID=1186196 RepID=A0A1H9AG50_9EURY|nr:monovalent cation/H(+) antiporter subunit G [Natrinema salaciae]SEP75477.1 multisubunit sodium/proton antiporter, MrpG subunit [Natrinema salaciae]
MIEAARFWAIVVLLGLGVFFTFVSTVGVIRLPDIYARAHTASQADTLGAGFALAGVAVAFGWKQGAIYTVLLLFFIFITNPTAAHAIARSAAETGVEPILAEEDTDADETDAPTETDGELT